MLKLVSSHSTHVNLILQGDGLHPTSRDEHTAVVYKNSMVVFGGFEQGVRTNKTIIFDFITKSWSEPEYSSKTRAPVPRAGHSAVVHRDAMYVFGGKDDENEKLKDLWRLDLTDFSWTKLSYPEQAVPPRSGHSCCVYGDHLIIFGGIQEITKELDDCLVYQII